MAASSGLRAHETNSHPDSQSAVRFAIEVIGRLLAGEVERMRAAGVPVGQDDFRGLYIADAEADRLVSAVVAGSGPSTPDDELASLFRDAPGTVGQLATLANLSPFETACVCLCLATEADLRLERLVAYVQDDVTRKRPRVEMTARLFGGGSVECLSSFDPGGRLRRHRLVALYDDTGQAFTPLPSRQLGLETRVFAFLAGVGDSLDEVLGPAYDPTAVPGLESFLSPDLLARCDELGARHAGESIPVLACSGDDDALVRTAAARVARAAALGVRGFSAPALSRLEEGFESALTLAAREAALTGSALLLTSTDELAPTDLQRMATRLDLGTLAPMIILASATPVPWPGAHVAVPALDFDGRQQLWRRETVAAGAAIDADDLESLAGKFKLPARGIVAAVAQAVGTALSHSPAAPFITPDDLYAAARAQSTPVLSNLARKVTPHYRWSDIVVSGDTFDQLREICGQVEHRHRVYDEWGFDRKLAMSKGVMALFTGQPGTGKTMAADVIANALGLDMYKIDLSGVVSKYIGETEKNLSTIFLQAERSNAVLFFDEADALFGKRSEVKDAHDRYANIETAYLLQQMEEYSGVVVLATNLRNNLDEAFLRRLHFVIEFAMPDEGQRRRIWEETLPRELPHETVDFDFLARTFKVAGGNIRNAVLAGAFLAAGEGVAPGMSHLMRGMRREYQKLGRMVTDAEFGPFMTLFRGD